MTSPRASTGIRTPVIRAMVLTNLGLLATDTPIAAARAGIIGSMYGASFDEDTEKNSRVTAENISRNFRGLKVVSNLESNHARRSAAGIVSSHGRAPIASMARKYHHGSSRLCTFVRNLAKCS